MSTDLVWTTKVAVAQQLMELQRALKVIGL